MARGRNQPILPIGGSMSLLRQLIWCVHFSTALLWLSLQSLLVRSLHVVFVLHEGSVHVVVSWYRNVIDAW